MPCITYRCPEHNPSQTAPLLRTAPRIKNRRKERCTNYKEPVGYCVKCDKMIPLSSAIRTAKIVKRCV